MVSCCIKTALIELDKQLAEAKKQGNTELIKWIEPQRIKLKLQLVIMQGTNK